MISREEGNCTEDREVGYLSELSIREQFGCELVNLPLITMALIYLLYCIAFWDWDMFTL